jgi:hypothetical protein
LEIPRLWIFLALDLKERRGIVDVKVDVVLFGGGTSSTLKLLKFSTPEQRLRLRRVKCGISSPSTSGSGKAILGGMAYFTLSRLSLSLKRLDVLSIFVTMESRGSDEEFWVNVITYSLELPFVMLYQNVFNSSKMETNVFRRYQVVVNIKSLSEKSD